MNDTTLLDRLNTLPLYLDLRIGTEGRRLDGSADLWPEWRRRLIEQRPRQRPATADVILLNALAWPLGMAHLAVAFLHGADLELQPRFDWRTDEALPGATTWVEAFQPVATEDPLGAAVARLDQTYRSVQPGLVLPRKALLAVTSDRAVQALLVLGQVTGERDRAAVWAQRLVELWPSRTRTRVERDDEHDRLVRASCCFYFLDAQQCANCPREARRP